MSNVITVWGNTGSSPSGAVYSQPSGGGIYPPNQVPGSGNTGTGTDTGPGGIGVGDGGFSTPSNLDFGIPVITFPNSGDNEDIEESDTVTASAFDDGGTGATHSASRWMILYLGSLDDPALLDSPIYLYDSGVDVDNLTTLPLTVVEFEHNSVYAVRVRYKGNDNTWSRWSVDQTFSTADCAVDATLVLHVDFSTTTGYEDSGSAITQVNNLGTFTTWVAPLASGDEAVSESSEFLSASAEFGAGAGGAYTSGSVTSGAMAATFFMVGQLGTAADDTFLGLTYVVDVPGAVLGSNYWIGVRAGAADTGSVSVSSAVSADPGWESAADVLAANERFLLEVVVQPSGDGDSKVLLNGVELYSAAVDWGLAICPMLEAYAASAAADVIGWIGELRLYDIYLSASQRQDIRYQLAAKWGVSL